MVPWWSLIHGSRVPKITRFGRQEVYFWAHKLWGPLIISQTLRVHTQRHSQSYDNENNMPWKNHVLSILWHILHVQQTHITCTQSISHEGHFQAHARHCILAPLCLYTHLLAMMLARNNTSLRFSWVMIFTYSGVSLMQWTLGDYDHLGWNALST